MIITRCLNDGEDIYVQHFAAKTIENVASTHGRHCAKFVSNDTAQVKIDTLDNKIYLQLIIMISVLFCFNSCYGSSLHTAL